MERDYGLYGSQQTAAIEVCGFRARDAELVEASAEAYEYRGTPAGEDRDVQAAVGCGGEV